MRIVENKFLSKKTVTTNRQDPFLYFIYANTLPPEEAYRVIHPKTNLVTNNLKETKVKGYKRRFIFDSYDNYTPYEKEFLVGLKQEMFKRHGIEMDKFKPLGPRIEDGIVIEGAQKPESGIDMHLHDSILLRFCVARFWDINVITNDLLYHLLWR